MAEEYVKLLDNQMVVQVDGKKMILFKENVIYHYELSTINSLNRSTPEYLRNMTKLYDKYLLHIIEEVSEFSEEVKKNVASEDTLYELIDVIGYLCSTLFLFKNESTFSVINDKIDMSGENDPNNFIRNIAIIKKEQYFTEGLSYFENINNILMKDCINPLIKARRQFDERKWHKNVSRKLSVYDLNKFYKNFECILGDVLFRMIKLFMVMTNFDYEKFNEMYEGKGKLVVEKLET